MREERSRWLNALCFSVSMRYLVWPSRVAEAATARGAGTPNCWKAVASRCSVVALCSCSNATRSLVIVARVWRCLGTLAEAEVPGLLSSCGKERIRWLNSPCFSVAMGYPVRSSPVAETTTSRGVVANRCSVVAWCRAVGRTGGSGGCEGGHGTERPESVPWQSHTSLNSAFSPP